MNDNQMEMILYLVELNLLAMNDINRIVLTIEIRTYPSFLVLYIYKYLGFLLFSCS